MKEEDPKPTCIDGIKVLFHDVLRLLCNSKKENHTSIESMLEKTGWLSINQLVCEVRLLEVWKAMYQEDYCLKDVFERVEKTSIRTRSSSQIKLKTTFKTRLRETCYQLPSVLLWNAAPKEVTEAQTESKARAAIRQHVKSNIPI